MTTSLIELPGPSEAQKHQTKAVKILDVPVSAIDIIKTLLALKFKKSPSEIPETSTIKTLAQGNLLVT